MSDVPRKASEIILLYPPPGLAKAGREHVRRRALVDIPPQDQEDIGPVEMLPIPPVIRDGMREFRNAQVKRTKNNRGPKKPTRRAK